MSKKMFVVLLFCSIFCVPLLAAAPDLTLDEITQKIQANQAKIKDMYAETTTTITSNMAMPGQENKGPQKMIQKGKMWIKGSDKSKIEMLSPLKQITITNGDQLAIINPETGQKMVQDLSRISKQGTVNSGQGQQMSLEKAGEYFNLSVQCTADSGQYVITGVPKEKNKFLGKMEFYVDSERWVPVKILMYDSKRKIMSQSAIEYGEFQGSGVKGQEEAVWVPVKNVSDVNTPMGKMKVEMEFEKIKVNQGMSDKEFAIE